jgi:hypothetical protein
MGRFWGVGLLLLAGCAFEPNLGDGMVACGASHECPPSYVCRADDRCWHSATLGQDDMSIEVSDFAHVGSAADLATGSPRDLASGGPRDLAMPPDQAPVCTSIARICPTSGQSAACVPFNNGYTQQIDRTCPPGSLCSTGYCQPPASPLGCTNTAGCAAIPNNVCDPFVITQGASKTIQGFCAGRFGTSTGNCTAVGFDSTCASGYCIATNANKVCMTLCAQTSDCTNGTTCAQRLVTVEGLTTMVSVCGK